jgi:hypothetical protein
MSATHFSGPVVSPGGFVGPVTGGITGNITGNLTGNVTGNVTGAVLATAPVNATAATLAVTQATHGGRVVTLNRAGGIVATLPAASGSGTVFRFVVGTTFTSDGIIKVANASDIMTGSALVVSDGADAVVGFGTAADTDTITLNGTTTGGYKGAFVEVIDVATNLFYVRVTTSATGSEATPFSATV